MSNDELIVNGHSVPAALVAPTLSFTEPVSQVSTPGSGDSLVGGALSAQHITRFDFDESFAEQAFEEISAEAELAGYELELSTSPELLPQGKWLGTSPDLNTLTILISPSGMQVTIR